MDLAAREYRRILIIKPSSFGDVIHAMPVLHGLRTRFPRARISWLVAHSCAGLLEGHPDLDEVIRFDRKRYGRIGKGLTPTIEFVRFLGDLHRRSFDLVLDLQGLFRSAFLTLAAGAQVTLGFANAREFAPLFYGRRITVPDPEMHAVDRNYLFSRALGFADLPVSFNMPVRSEAAAAVATVLADHGIARGHPYALMGPGTRWETKRWPAEAFAEVARRVRAELGLPVVLIGMEDEAGVAWQVEQAAGEGIVNLAGRTKLPELIALVAGAALCVMHDSGPMHLATALDRPMVAIYGPTSPRRTGPYRRPEAIVRLDLPCSPCYIKRVADCPYDHRCMRKLPPDTLMDRLRLSYPPGVNDR
ncbi:MAG TPA: lipopolysaccharide heptosyltransferase I [Phycisphaerae bacterium]|nr:lipopolysaccharide heptosyltransferase I [Phycisphaerae bacterium]HRR83718.1 lipopolysaccharide heptosyltransferase I [Phycisphaerae bacterium]